MFHVFIKTINHFSLESEKEVNSTYKVIVEEVYSEDESKIEVDEVNRDKERVQLIYESF